MNILRNNNIKNILLIDGFNLFLRNFSVCPTLSPDGTHNGGLFGTLNSIKSLINKFTPDAVLVIFDGRGGSEKRKNIDPNYKISRKIPTRINTTYDYETIEDERKAIQIQLGKFLIYLNILPVVRIMIDKIEADDLIAYITQKYCLDKKVIICSTDKDFYQLVDKNRVMIWRPTTKEIINEEYIRANFFNINPKNFTIYRSFIGDASDCITGINGIGPATIHKLFGNYLESEQEICIDDIIEECKKQQTNNKKYSIILENEEKIRKNFLLSQLASMELSEELKSSLDKIISSNIPILRSSDLKAHFLKDKLYFHIKNIDSWLQSFTHCSNVARLTQEQFILEKNNNIIQEIENFATEEIWK